MSFRPLNPNITNNVVADFESFFQGWLHRQEHYLEELLSAEKNSHQYHDSDLNELIARVMSHYQQYYDEKSKLADHNVFLVFSPTWFTPFERTFFWISGFKPSLLFRLVEGSVNDMTEDQKQRIEMLISETKVGERVLGEQLERIQMSVADPPIVELAKKAGRQWLRDGEIHEADDVVDTLRASMESVLRRADWLRTRTAEKVMDVLSPVQKVRFLTAAARLQKRIRVWGLQRMAERGLGTLAFEE